MCVCVCVCVCVCPKTGQPLDSPQLLQCVAVCCSVLQCVALCCSVLQRVAVCCSVLQCVADGSSVVPSSENYRVAKTHRMAYLYRSFSAKEPYN